MSWQTCYSGSNNIHFDYPPIMNDGRNFSSWSPESVINEQIIKAEGIQSNWSYRQYLQRNGEEIMNYNSASTCNYSGVNPHILYDRTPSSNVPYKFKSNFDTSTPGFGYCNSDLKNFYLTREQLNARMTAPSITPNK